MSALPQRRVTTFWPIKFGGTPEFQTDGCSGWITWFYRTVLHRDPPWEGCCEAHDALYWPGGTWYDRLKADLGLYECICKISGPKVARRFYRGVRFGGGPYSPLSWRWNYREPWLRSRYTE